MSGFDLSGRVALVTGASRGLGEAMALALARAGADVAVTSRSLEALEPVRDAIESLGRAAFPVALDVREHDSIRRAAAAAIERFGRVDVLVNNAGLNVRKPALELTWEEWNLVLDTNLRGAFFVAQAVAPGMIERGRGRIVNIGSVTSVLGAAAIAPYGASRGGIKQLTMSLADEWGPHGVTVNCLAPGSIRTAQTEALYQSEAWVASMRERIPLRRPGVPQDLDGAIVFLASDASAYVTGQLLLVDGGLSVGSLPAAPPDLTPLRSPSDKV
jgi:NAD(P)-dependent dehydrogenase (short-subunit alcohol dehydrogenase family)